MTSLEHRSSRTFFLTIKTCRKKTKPSVECSRNNKLLKLKGPSQPHVCFCLHARIRLFGILLLISFMQKLRGWSNQSVRVKKYISETCIHKILPLVVTVSFIKENAFSNTAADAAIQVYVPESSSLVFQI